MNIMKLIKNRAGDTMVEVMLAAVILSMMLVGAYTLSARATRLNQSAYERTRAMELVQEQAELLRAARDQASPAWSSAVAITNAPFADCRTSAPPTDLSAGRFYLDPTGSFKSGPTTASPKITDIYTTWVTRITAVGNTYHDFYIYTCWMGAGDFGRQMAGTVVRLGAP